MSATLESSLLDQLLSGESLTELCIAVVVAHPDDEIIGCGAHLPLWPGAHIIHVTDGAPHKTTDATAAGCASREQYACVRLSESLKALGLAGIAPSRLRQLKVPDQQAAFALSEVTLLLEENLTELRPDAILTHAYEGGHPDHDATAFAVHAACKRLLKRVGRAPVIMEMSSYFNSAGSMATASFLPREGVRSREQSLSTSQRELKRHMFDCFATQRNVLQYFPIAREVFRFAPEYDFSRPPHEGRLYYELFDWGIQGLEWRRNARQALAILGLAP